MRQRVIKQQPEKRADFKAFVRSGRTFKNREHPALHSAFESIVETIFNVDVHAEYARLRAEIKVGDQGRRHRDTLLEALDKAEDNARTARDLAVIARAERERWLVKQTMIMASMRSHALVSLQQDKQAGILDKRITNEDVENKVAEMFSDEYEYAKEMEAKVKGMVESLETFANLCEHRCSSLQTMLGALKK